MLLGAGDTTEAARIFFLVEELLLRYVDPAKVAQPMTSDT
jgi:hypothetical protein